MQSGHSYFREHLKNGDLRKICSLNEIEAAVIEQVLTEENLDIIKTEGHVLKTFDLWERK